MVKTKRVGPISPDLLPIPTEEEYGRVHDTEWYAVGPRDGFTKDALPTSFYDELRDLMRRYGGVDADGDPRLRPVIADMATEEHFYFWPVKRSWTDMGATLDELLENLDANMANLNIAQDNVSRAVREIKWHKENRMRSKEELLK